MTGIKRIVLFVTLFLICASSVFAKEGKIKYNKCLRYEGELIEKFPSGNGCINIIDQKKVILRVPGIYHVEKDNSYDKKIVDMVITVNSAKIEILNGWNYVGSLSMVIQGSKDQDVYNLSLNLKEGTITNFDNSISLKSDEPLVFNIKTSNDGASITLEPNLDSPIGIHMSDYSTHYLVQFNSQYDNRQAIDGTYSGTAWIKPAGILNLSVGSFYNNNGEFSIVRENNSYRLVSLKKGTNSFVMDGKELVLKHLNVENKGYHVIADIEKYYRNESRYNGTINDSQKEWKYSGSFLLKNDSSDPIEYLKNINHQKITFVSGVLDLGDKEHFEGKWSFDNTFVGIYSNYEKKIELDSCQIDSKGIISGIGKQQFDDSSVFYGSFDNCQKNGYGQLIYSNELISGMWVNDSLYSGETKVEMADVSFTFIIKQAIEGYHFYYEDSDLGVSETVKELFETLPLVSRNLFIQNHMSNSDLSRAKKLLIGNSFVCEIDPSLFEEDGNGNNGNLANNGAVFYEIGFVSGNNAFERMVFVPFATCDSIMEVNATDAIADSCETIPDYSPQLLFEESDYYRITGDSIFLYNASSFALGPRLYVTPKGTDLRADIKNGQRLIFSKRKEE